jgi:uncharacterized protein YidB (DUF937 family)
MGVFDEALKKSVPGGKLTKPLIIAAGALILAKWLGGGKEEPAPAPGQIGKPRSPADIMPPESKPAPLPGPGGQGQGRQGQPQTIDIDTSGREPPRLPDEGLSGGLGGLLDKLRKGGLGEEADSWVKTGPNKPVEPGRLKPAIGEMTISEIARRAGTTEEDIAEILTQVLPQLVDNLTPEGKVPTQQDVDRWGKSV